jgi:hypothetical protein
LAATWSQIHSVDVLMVELSHAIPLRGYPGAFRDVVWPRVKKAVEKRMQAQVQRGEGASWRGS